MSDVFDIQSQCSEIDDGGSATCALKDASKVRKGRGFVRNSGGEIRNIKVFDRLEEAGPGATKSSSIQPQGSVEGWVLFVTGIHEEATEEDVKELFNDHGIIRNIMLNLDRRTGYIKGHALIEYEKYVEATAAIENLNDSQLLGQNVKIDWCFTKGPNLVDYNYSSGKGSSSNRYSSKYK